MSQIGFEFYKIFLYFFFIETIKKRNMILEFGHRNKIFLRPAWKPLHTLKHFNNMPMMNLDNSIKIYE